MQLMVRNLAAEEVGSVDLDESIFGVPVRRDILHRVVLWQLAKRRAGTHKVKTRAEIARTGAKLYKQKGTGRARHGSRRANIFRGGGVAHGPQPRDYEHALPRKVRMLGMKCALSSKVAEGQLIVLDEARLEERKTKAFRQVLDGLGLGSVLIITGSEVDANLRLASRNLPHVDVLPAQGLNVYDILRRDKLVLTREAIAKIGERFHGGPDGAGAEDEDDNGDDDVGLAAAGGTTEIQAAAATPAGGSVPAIDAPADATAGAPATGEADEAASPASSADPGSSSVLPSVGVAAAVGAVAVGVAAAVAAVVATRKDEDGEEKQS